MPFMESFENEGIHEVSWNIFQAPYDIKRQVERMAELVRGFAYTAAGDRYLLLGLNAL
jgi:hypothetical protein